MAQGRLRANGTPVFWAVAYPSHVLWLPPRLWIVNGVLLATVTVGVGILTGDLFSPEFGLPVAIGFHLYGAWHYRRDRYIVGVWKAALFGSPYNRFSRPKDFGLTRNDRYSIGP